MECLLKGRPSTDREDTRYLAEMIEVLTHVSPREHEWLRDPRDGLATRCKFLPTPADVFEFIRERQAKADQFKPVPPRGPIFRDDGHDPRPDVARRRRVVQELLGYDPQRKGTVAKRDLTPATADDIATVRRMAKTQPQPLTPEFVEWLASQRVLL